MKLLVCIKYLKEEVPFESDKVLSHMSPEDRSAIEAALCLKEQYTLARLTTMSMGPLAAKEILEESLAMGADEAVLVTDSKFQGADTFMTSNILSRAIRMNPFSCIICGSHSSDGATGQVGPGLAVWLGTAFVSNVVYIEKLQENLLLCQRHVDAKLETIQVELPIVITIDSNAYRLRLKKLKDIFHSEKKPLHILSNREIQLPENICGYTGSPTKVRAIKKVHQGDKKLMKNEKDQDISAVMKLILDEMGYSKELG